MVADSMADPTMIEPLGDPSHRLRIGAVNYLNTKPLVHGLEELLSNAQLVYDLPSRLSDALAGGELDIALVPSIELSSHPEWSIVSDACIGCRGPVLSVKLMFRAAPADVLTLALDEGSRTSAVLAQILLHDLYKVRPQLTSLPLGCGPEETEADAVLVIGDRAIRSPQGDFIEVWDLGDRWCRWAELPFVFAMWVARPGIATGEAASALAAARDRGCHDLPQIIRQQSEAMQLPFELVQEYLRDNLYYHLGSKQLQGLELFYQRAADLGLIQVPPRIMIHDCPIEHP